MTIQLHTQLFIALLLATSPSVLLANGDRTGHPACQDNRESRDNHCHRASSFNTVSESEKPHDDQRTIAHGEEISVGPAISSGARPLTLDSGSRIVGTPYLGRVVNVTDGHYYAAG